MVMDRRIEAKDRDRHHRKQRENHVSQVVPTPTKNLKKSYKRIQTEVEAKHQSHENETNQDSCLDEGSGGDCTHGKHGQRGRSV